MKFLILLMLIFIITSCASDPFGKSSKTLKLRKFIAEAQNSKKKNNYQNAAFSYNKAIIESESVAPKYTKTIKNDLANVYLEYSRQLFWKAKQDRSVKLCENAIKMLEKAKELNPSRKLHNNLHIKRLKKQMASLAYTNATDIKTIDASRKERNLKIDLFLKQGQVFFNNRQFTHSRDKYESALVLDPYNLRAIRGLHNVMKELTNIGAKRRKLSEKERLAECEWQYVQKIAQKAETNTKENEVPTEKNLEDILDNCIISNINFNDTPLNQTFQILNKKIILSSNKNFSFKFKNFTPNDKNFPLVNFSVKEITAKNAILAICNTMNLNIKYSKDSVIISK